MLHTTKYENKRSSGEDTVATKWGSENPSKTSNKMCLNNKRPHFAYKWYISQFAKNQLFNRINSNGVFCMKRWWHPAAFLSLWFHFLFSMVALYWGQALIRKDLAAEPSPESWNKCHNTEVTLHLFHIFPITRPERKSPIQKARSPSKQWLLVVYIS